MIILNMQKLNLSTKYASVAQLDRAIALLSNGSSVRIAPGVFFVPKILKSKSSMLDLRAIQTTN